MNAQKRREYKIYYQKYKELADYHKKLFGNNKSPHIPNKFTENLCREIMGIQASKSRQYDGVKNDKNYEIKATCLPNHDTTFSTISNPDIILWACIDTTNNVVKIYNVSKVSLKANIKAKIKKRANESKPKPDRDGKLKTNLLIKVCLLTINQV